MDTENQNEAREERQDRYIAYGVLRLTLGIDMVLHGLVRIFGEGGVAKFAGGLLPQFEKTILPVPLVQAFGLTLPFVEALIGLSLILGLFTRWGLALGGLTMTALVFGTALRAEWNTLVPQLLHAAVFFALHWLRYRYNAFSLDAAIQKKQPAVA